MADPRAEPGKGPLVKCPTCGREMRFDTSNPFRPFCSQRCRTTDLGAWASESYRIPDATPPDGALLPDSSEED